MIGLRISGCILAITSIAFAQPIVAQDNPETIKQSTEERSQVKGIQFSSDENAVKVQAKPSNRLFEGFSVSADLVGLALRMLGDYGQYEGALRVNMKNRYFPTVEAGYGTCDYTGEDTKLHYKASAPYFRIGCDYNLIKKPESGNRILVGARYAFTSFKYDIDGPSQYDPIWGGIAPYRFEGLQGGCHWVELLFGLEAKIFKAFHIGWNIRYKARLSQEKSEIGQAWYVPGFGKNDKSSWTGTFNFILDI